MADPAGWYLSNAKNVAQGPYAYDALRTFVEAKKIDARTPVWREGMTTWVRLKDRPELAALVETAAVPPPIPMPKVTVHPVAVTAASSRVKPTLSPGWRHAPLPKQRTSIFGLVLLLTGLVLGLGSPVWGYQSYDHWDGSNDEYGLFRFIQSVLFLIACGVVGFVLAAIGTTIMVVKANRRE